MADITMCTGENCPVKDKCYRFTAVRSEYMQSQFVISPIKDGKCQYYWGENAEHIFDNLKDIVNGRF